MDFLTSLINVGLLSALGLPGFILRKFKMVTGEFSDGLATILLYVSFPFVTISTFTRTGFDSRLLVNMGLTVVLGMIMLLGSYFVSLLCFMPLKKNAAQKAGVACGYMSNSAFMGIPVIQTFFPDRPETVVYAAMYGIAFNVIAWTLLVYTLTGDKKYISLKAALLNPGTLSVVIALPVLLFDISFPSQITRVIDWLGNLTTPLAMFIVGIRLAEIRLREIFTAFVVYWSAMVKLVVVPLFAFCVIILAKILVGLDGNLAVVIYILMMMPSASFVIVFSEKFGGDRVTSVKCVLLSTLLSVITIPVMLLLSSALS
ncbi:MAG: AEC family transporter [Treponema sp.]|jgi:predicted permease|nr:AEC family transporter [Treponema sp.]